MVFKPLAAAAKPRVMAGRVGAAIAVAALIGGVFAAGASAQAADPKQVTVKKGPLTITMPAVVNVRAKACVAVPYEYKVEPASAGTNISIFVRNKSGEAVAGEYLNLPPAEIEQSSTINLDSVGDTALSKAVSGKSVLRFCGQPQRATTRFGGPWAAAPSGAQRADAQLLSYSGSIENAMSVSVPFQLNVVRRK